MVVEQESMQQRQTNVQSGTMSPLRKAMSLSTLFRHSIDAKQNQSAQSQTQAQAQAQAQTQSKITTQSNLSSGSTLVPQAIPSMKRMRRRLSFRKSPSMSPKNAFGAGQSSVSPQSCTGTPSSVASSSRVFTPASLSSSSGSPFSAAQINPRGRPRSGSCRASLLSGGGRLLPFTIPGSTTEEELSVDETPKSKRASMRISRARSTSSSPPIPPRRPITPAPLLILDEEMNSLGISTGPIASWLASPSSRTPTDLSVRQNGLGLSAPFASSYPEAPMTQLQLPPSSMHRLSMCPSQESFHCRGLAMDNKGKTDEHSSILLPSNEMVPPPMIRSVSATNSTSEASKARTNKDINPGSPLGWRRRPWALSLQLQPHGHPSRPLASPTGLTPPPTSRPAKIEESSHLPSRFSLSSEDTANTSRLDSNQQTDEEENEIQEDEMSSFIASPGSEWSSSAFSFDTTLESPASRQESRFTTSPDSSSKITATIRRRSNTVSAIPDPRPSSYVSLSSKPVRKPIPVMQITRDSTVNDDIPAICPASPPVRVRLHLSLPPSTVSKGLPQAHTMLMPTTASTLEFKETICRSLQIRHGLSISPSQLGLFVPEQQNESNLSLSPNQSPLHLGVSGGNASPFNRSPCLPSSSSLGQSKTGFLRSRLRSSSNAGARVVSADGIPSSLPSTSYQQQQQQTASSRSQTFRQMQNESALYQEGLQDDDLIIVRF